jgi:hypothetical protein
VRAPSKLIAVAATAAAAFLSPRPSGLAGQPATRRPRVTIVGVDGASWGVLDPLVARGEVPHFARLIAGGTRAPLRSRIPLWSPAVWTTIATGVRRERHGVTGFLDRDGHLVASVHRRVPALWTLASNAGLRTAVIGWWVTYPAEAINGVIVSERALKSRDMDLRVMAEGGAPAPPARGLFHPPSIAESAADILSVLPGRPAESAVRDATIPRMRAEDAAVVRLLRRVRERAGPFAVELLLLRGVDPVSHYFWRFHEPDAAAYAGLPSPSSEERARYGAAVADYYKFVDGLLGELPAVATPDHAFLILSDHGFEAGIDGELTGTHQTRAALDGMFIASGGPFRRNVALAGARILDIAPTVLHVLGLPVAEDLDGRILTEALEPAWLEAHPPRYVASYPDAPVLLDLDAWRSGTGSPVDASMREQLRALGYIE